MKRFFMVFLGCLVFPMAAMADSLLTLNRLHNLFGETDLRSSFGKRNGFFAIRLFVVNSFDDTVQVTFCSSRGSGIGYVRYSKSDGVLGSVSHGKEIKLTEIQTSNIVGFFNASGFWGLRQSDNPIGFDGQVWVFEAFDGHNYYHVERYSPLPPYYQATMDMKTGKISPADSAAYNSAIKHSDEVALDMLGLVLMLSVPDFNESLY